MSKKISKKKVKELLAAQRKDMETDANEAWSAYMVTASKLIKEINEQNSRLQRIEKHLGLWND
jgi:hypothetical protein